MIVLMGVLRMPPEMWLDDPIDIGQRYSRYLEAADRIEKLEGIILNGLEYGNDIIDHHANIIGQMKKEKVALWSIVRCLCPDKKERADLIEKHFSKIGA